MSRLMRRAFTVLTLALLALFAGAGVASAHAELDASSPADGANLPAAPAELQLRFTLPVELPATRVVLTDDAERPFAVGIPRATASTPAGVTAVAVGLPVLGRGSYRLSWRTISVDDLHVTSGVVAFGVQQDAPPPAEISDPPPDPTESAARWIGFGGLAALLGAAGLFGLLGPLPAGPARTAARRTLVGLAVAGGALAVAGDVGLLVAQAAAAAGPGGDVGAALTRLLTTPPRAPRWWARETALVVVLGCALLARRAVRAAAGVPRVVLAVGVAAAAAVGVTGAVLGHSAGSGPVRVATDAAHELSAMTWAGGLLAVVAVLVGRPRDAAARAVLSRFSLLAGGCVAVLTVTGLMLTGTGVASLDALLLSHFGLALLVKVGLMVVALGLALVNTLAVHGDRRPPRRGLVLEAAVLLAALGAAAVLGASPHATGPSWRAPDGAVPLLSATAGDLVESVAISPNQPGGPNVVTVHVLDSRRPAPAPITAVTVGIAGVDGVAQPTEAGTFVLVTDRLTVAGGVVGVTVSVTRAGLVPQVADFAWTVSDPTAPRRVATYSAAPIATPLGVAAAVTAVFCAAALGWAVVATRRRSRHDVRRPHAAPPRARAGASAPE